MDTNKFKFLIFGLFISAAVFLLLSFFIFQQYTGDVWPTYENKLLGFEIKYPKNLKPIINRNADVWGISFADAPDGPWQFGIYAVPTDKKTTDDWIADQNKTLPLGQSYRLEKKMEVNGADGGLYIYKEAADTNPETNETFYTEHPSAIFIKDSRLYILNTRGNDLNTFNKMLDSLRFY